MKTIGIVAVTMVGATICANQIVKEALAKGSDNHPEIIMHALPFARYKNAVIKSDWDLMAGLIVQSINILKKSGAEFIVIPSNTPHYAYQEISQRSDLQVLNLVEITADECEARGFKRVAVLGTRMTMQDGLYDSYLNDRGIIPVIPSKDTMDAIHNFIMDEIIPSKVNHASIDRVKCLIQQLSCDAVILGCTELPEVYSEDTLKVPAIDTTRLLANKALQYAYE